MRHHRAEQHARRCLPASDVPRLSSFSQMHAHPTTRLLPAQGCALHSIPAQLGAASKLQRLRIGSNGSTMRIEAEALDTLAELQSLTFLSVAKVRR